MDWSRAPSFRTLFESPSGEPAGLYLDLLWLREAGAALRAVHDALEASPHLEREVVALLEDQNWRPVLVGATAVAMGAGSEGALDALWARADDGCWVSPQLAVAASRSDPRFEPRARARLEAGDRARPSELKLLGALVALVDQGEALPWSDEAGTGRLVAKTWRENLEAALVGRPQPRGRSDRES